MSEVTPAIEAVYGGGQLVNATGNYVNAYTGETEAFAAPNTMTAQMKTYYDTEALENARANLRYGQFGKRQVLPRNHGKTIEWRKPNTFGDVGQLTEGVIPTGKKFGYSAITADIYQYGDYSTFSDQLDMHAIDPVILDATQELSAAAANTQDKLIRDVVTAGTNVIYAPNGSTAINARASLVAGCVLTPDLVARARTQLVKANTPTIDGDYVAIIHPSCTYDLRKDEDWLEYHKYASPDAIFEGEIGKLHGVRFIETTNCKIWNNAASGNNAVYGCIFFGKDAWALIDPEGGGLEIITKNRQQAGGPLEQFSTVGVKFETAAKILYQERLVRVECCSSYSTVDEAN